MCKFFDILQIRLLTAPSPLFMMNNFMTIVLSFVIQTPSPPYRIYDKIMDLIFLGYIVYLQGNFMCSHPK